MLCHWDSLRFLEEIYRTWVLTTVSQSGNNHALICTISSVHFFYLGLILVLLQSFQVASVLVTYLTPPNLAGFILFQGLSCWLQLFTTKLTVSENLAWERVNGWDVWFFITIKLEHVVNRDISRGSLIAHKHCLVAGFSFFHTFWVEFRFYLKKKLHISSSPHMNLWMSSISLDNAFLQPLDVLPMAISCLECCCPSARLLLSLPLHSASSKVMASLFSTVV